MSRTYWRSLAQAEDRPESRAFIEREFQEGASELPEGVTRRDMMMLLGASLSLAGLAGCRRPVEEIVPFVTAPEEIIPGIPRYYATTMPFRRSAYGLIVESHEGRPTKVEGNPSHPSTLGASSSRVQASVLGLYDPDRSQTYRLKGEAKSAGDFVTAWTQLSEAHAASGGAGLAVLSESFSSPTLARLSVGTPVAVSAAAVGDLRGGQRREPARGSTGGHGTRSRPRAPAGSGVGHSGPRRRPAPH